MSYLDVFLHDVCSRENIQAGEWTDRQPLPPLPLLGTPLSHFGPLTWRLVHLMFIPLTIWKTCYDLKPLKIFKCSVLLISYSIIYFDQLTRYPLLSAGPPFLLTNSPFYFYVFYKMSWVLLGCLHECGCGVINQSGTTQWSQHRWYPSVPGLHLALVLCSQSAVATASEILLKPVCRNKWYMLLTAQHQDLVFYS